MQFIFYMYKYVYVFLKEKSKMVDFEENKNFGSKGTI